MTITARSTGLAVRGVRDTATCCPRAPLAPRRMPADLDPLASDHDGDDVVELQGDYRRASRCCAPNDPRTVAAPRRVSGPPLTARIEQCRASSGAGVGRADLSRLVAVAQSTGKPEVVLLVCATCNLRNDVIDLERTQDVPLWALTISTPVACRCPNLRPTSPRYPAWTHDSDGPRRPRRTASRRASAFRSNPCW